jgi:hypothetical protein
VGREGLPVDRAEEVRVAPADGVGRVAGRAEIADFVRDSY